MIFKPFQYRISELSSHDPVKGNILISEPFMADKYFKRSVVLLCENNDDGTVGFILNQELELKLNDVISEDLGFNAPLFLGGPVEPQNLFFIHRCNDLPERIEIENGLFWSGDFDLLKIYLKAGKISSNEIRFFLGYSGWDKTQLEDEIKSESWLVSKLNHQFFFRTNPKNLWKIAMQEMGEKQAILSTFPEDPSLN